jgi:hypothetical protein
MGKARAASPSGTFALLAAALLVLSILSTTTPPVALAASFGDMSGQPAEIQSAVDYVTGMGYMNGAGDGNFHPAEPMARMDLARALVRLFKNLQEDLDPGIKFKDIKVTNPDYEYANLAVKHQYLSPFSDGSFRPNDPVTCADAMRALVVGLGLTAQVQHLMGLYPRGPSHEGFMVVAHDLHLRYRNTRVWPTSKFPRGEMAFSLEKADKLDEWRAEYVRESFDWLHCQCPWLGPLRQKAMDAAFSQVGYPYVWGGESDTEGGFDCSGLVYFVLEETLGYPMMRVADDQARDGRYPSVGREELMAGDPIFFYGEVTGSSSAYIDHAGMYIGQGLFIHSTGGNSGVSVDRLTGYWLDHFAWGKRVIPEQEPETFDTYILLMNPGSGYAAAKLTYMMPAGQQADVDVSLAPYSRQTVKVDDTLVNQEVSTKVTATRGQVVAERSMYFRYRGKYPGGHNSAGVTSPDTQWYLPEGCTAYGFDTFILVQNPGSEPAHVKLTYMTAAGSTLDQVISVGPCSRYTVAVDSVPGMEKAEFSTLVDSDRPVVVERSMYFDYNGIREGSNSPAASSLSSDWYFAEGYTAPGSFDSYILIMNPSAGAVPVTVTLTDPAGRTADVKFDMPPHSRRTLAVDRVEGWDHAEFSARVHSGGAPVAAERAMYFRYGGIAGGHNAIEGGHDAMGCPAPSKTWYLAEGYTGQNFDTYILISNPGNSKARVAVRYMLNGGRYVDRAFIVAPRSRYTVPVNKVKGLANEEVSAYLASSQPIVVERSMYFRYGRVQGGSCSGGVTAPSVRWYFAEGYTGK